MAKKDVIKQNIHPSSFVSIDAVLRGFKSLSMQNCISFIVEYIPGDVTVGPKCFIHPKATIDAGLGHTQTNQLSR